MFTADPLYGATDLPGWTTKLLLTPEVQRLRGIRLINSSSPSLAALSDARRYTHTLGVIRLTLKCLPALGASYDDRRALVVAAMCHDLGTPPFGHVFEYLLSAMTGWSHEDIVQSILEGNYRHEGKYHQIMLGRQLALGRELVDAGIEPRVVAGLARGEGGLGKLVSGSLDLDNIDNVFRMAMLLGLPGRGGRVATELAESLQIGDRGVTIPANAIGLLECWATTRRLVYEVLAFDETNLKGQAMLTDCLTAALASGDIVPENWFWTDERLLYKLEQHNNTKDIVQRFIVGDLYETIFVGWYNLSKGPTDWRHPAQRKVLQDALEAELGFPCSPYVFYDNGTFSKSLDLHISGLGTASEVLGMTTSRSTIVAVFTPRQKVAARARRAAMRVLDELGFSSEALQAPPNKASIYGLLGQTTLPL
ncbi:HD domain-containing protein [soil metagenome]